jgi:16S rRNA (uracil1498-N3)-methyltransferase
MAQVAAHVEEAAKQSKQTVIPSVDLAESIDGALAALDAARTLSVVLEPGASVGLSQTLMEQRAEAGRVALWVGPEGGWSASESERFSVAGVQAARLSRGVLRTETAGPVAVAVARVALEDW